MAEYSYKVKDKRGRIKTGIIKADSKTSVVAKLQRDGYYPISIIEKESHKAKTGAAILSRRISLQTFERIRNKDIVVFTRQLSNLINSRMPIVKALDVLIKQTENKRLNTVIQALKEEVQDGAAFSEALAKHPKIFSNLYTGMVRAGESGGVLDIVLTELAEFSEEEEALRNRVKSALAYPAVMVLVGGATVIFLLSFVIPRFVMMFSNINQTLPLPTRMLIFGSHSLRVYWWIYLLIVFLALLAFRQYTKREEGRIAFDRAKLDIPVFGKVFRKILIARFNRTLGTLIKSGVPILKAIKITQGVIVNRIFSVELNKIYDGLKEGKSLSQLLTQSKEFPPIIADMVAVGEKTGNLGDSLFKIATSYEEEVENELKALTSLLEPVIILIMGVIVGFIVLSMLLPVFELTAVMR